MPPIFPPRKTHLDLFSGIGGFAVAARNCGYVTVGFCEKEPYAQQILKEQFGAVLADASRGYNGREVTGSVDQSEEERRMHEYYGCPCASRPILHPDIFALDGADYAGVDLLTGGFPCQPFSIAGKRRGAADDRALWPEMLRVIDGSKPAWIIGENVAGIVTMELDNILSDLEGVGYTAWPLIIPACAVDARHRRDRVWIVAHAKRGAGGQGSAEWGGETGTRARDEFAGSGEDVADAECVGRQGPDDPFPGQGETGMRRRPAYPCRWMPEPELGRVAHGIPHRAHRLRGLENAIVPQVAEEIIRAIAAA